MSLREAIAEQFVLWELAWPARFTATPAMVAFWAAEMEAEGITPEGFQAASVKLRRTSQYPPDLPKAIAEARTKYCDPAHREFKALPMPDEPPITADQKREILESLNPGARKMFVSVLYGDANGRVKGRHDA